MITVYFDGNCILCSTEILYYKRILKEKLEIKDISEESFIPPVGYSFQQMNNMMHVSVDNEFYVGIAAFKEIWKILPKKYVQWKILLFLISVPGISTIATLLYKGFAKYRKFLPKKN